MGIFGQCCLSSLPNHLIMKCLYVSTLLLAASVLGDESFSGNGEMKCYGDMSITLDKWDEGDGFLNCKPAWGSPAAPPQGIIADGADGSHWVTVDDKGYGDCSGHMEYTYGDLGLGYCDRWVSLDDGQQTRLFCGYATCTGYLNIHCSMLSGCHGA